MPSGSKREKTHYENVRKDLDNLVPLEEFVKFSHDVSSELNELEALLEGCILNSKPLDKKQWVRLRNRIFCELFMLTPSRPGECASLLVRNVTNAKPTRNKEKTLFFTYAVEESAPEDAGFPFHKTGASFGTKYLFVNKILSTNLDERWTT